MDNFLHVSVIRTSVVAAVDRFEAARADLAALSFDALTAAQALSIKDRLETVSRPDALRKAAERLLALVHPDGDFSDADRARRRHLPTGHQQADGMSPISGMLDPEARATLEAVLAKWASPGMCNPDDETPCVDGTPSDAAIHNDQRSPGPTPPRRAEYRMRNMTLLSDEHRHTPSHRAVLPHL